MMANSYAQRIQLRVMLEPRRGFAFDMDTYLKS